MECSLDNAQPGYFNGFHYNGNHTPNFSPGAGGDMRNTPIMDCGHYHHQFMGPGGQNGYGGGGGAGIQRRNTNSMDISPKIGSVAMSMNPQPFVPKQVMDIARPTPISKVNNARREPQSGGSCRCGFCPEPAAMMQQQEPGGCCYGGQQHAERGRSMDAPHHRHSAHFPSVEQAPNAHHFIGHTACCQEANGGTGAPLFDGGDMMMQTPPQMGRSRSMWRSTAQAPADFSKPTGPPFMQQQHQVFNGPNGHCHCMNPNCPIHQSITPMYIMEGGGGGGGAGGNNNNNNVNGVAPYQRSRSYEMLDGGVNGMVHNFNAMNMNGGGGPGMGKKTKAALPPASHHSPEQRTSYRDHSRP